MRVLSTDKGVGWNARTRKYHRIKYNQYITVAWCEPGTLIDLAGKPEDSEREPCKKCFPNASSQQPNGAAAIS